MQKEQTGKKKKYSFIVNLKVLSASATLWNFTNDIRDRNRELYDAFRLISTYLENSGIKNPQDVRCQKHKLFYKNADWLPRMEFQCEKGCLAKIEI